jgi:hypothetical protein
MVRSGMKSEEERGGKQTLLTDPATLVHLLDNEINVGLGGRRA